MTKDGGREGVREGRRGPTLVNSSNFLKNGSNLLKLLHPKPTPASPSPKGVERRDLALHGTSYQKSAAWPEEFSKGL